MSPEHNILSVEDTSLPKEQLNKVDRSLYVENKIIPRLWLDSKEVREETVRHHLNRYNLAAKFVQQGDIVVDICSGTGYGTDILQKAGSGKAIGVDLSEEAISYAINQYPHCIFINDDVNTVLGENALLERFPPRVITFFEAIEHLKKDDGIRIINSARNSLASDGHFFISTPRDIRSNVNPDHITQWDFDELHMELTGRFKNVDMFGQDWATGEFSMNNPREASFFVAHCSVPRR